MPTTTVNLSETPNLQAEIEGHWDEGVRSFNVHGLLRQPTDSYAALRITSRLSGIAIRGHAARIDGAGRTSHVVAIDNADATIEGVAIVGGDTTARRYGGRWGRGLDGAGALILGNCNVTFRNCGFAYNHSGMSGGAISNQGAGLVSVQSCEFVGNTAHHAGSAIDNRVARARLSVLGSHFRDNRSNTCCARDFAAHGQISVARGTSAIIRNSDFIGDTFAIDAAAKTTVTSDNQYNRCSPDPVRLPGAYSMSAYVQHLRRLALRSRST